MLGECSSGSLCSILNAVKLRMIRDCVLLCILISICVALVGQIPGANATIPGMFPNMFPLATGQVLFSARTIQKIFRNMLLLH